jgi:hypothetical protein
MLLGVFGLYGIGLIGPLKYFQPIAYTVLSGAPAHESYFTRRRRERFGY